ncbi:MAG: leucine-rich repeat protein, partial [Candidatus Izemoplasmatales bacterium]
GTDGIDGKEVLFLVDGGYIKWKYEGEETWNNLIDLVSLTGPSGINGTDGEDGIDGKEVEFQENLNYIQWRYVGDVEWINLVSLFDITGPAGNNGKEVLLTVEGEYLKWKYLGEETWENLVSLTAITGPAGIDGLEVLVQVNGDFLQWKYAGEVLWKNLYDISSLEGLGISTMLINEFGELVVTYTDTTVVNLGQLNVLNLVSFLDGEKKVIDVQLVRNTESAVAPDDPELEGHVFMGWDIDFSNVNSDLTVSAVFSTNSYIISFDCDEGTPIETMILNYGDALSLSLPQKEGYNFLGWYDGIDANARHIVNGELVKTDLNLYARWQRETSVTVSNSNELRNALNNPAYDEIVFANDISLYYPLEIYRPTTINGNGYKLLSYVIESAIYVINEFAYGSYETNYPTNSYLRISDLDIEMLNHPYNTFFNSAIQISGVSNFDLDLTNVNITTEESSALSIENTNNIRVTVSDSIFVTQPVGIYLVENSAINVFVKNSTIEACVPFDFSNNSFSSLYVSGSQMVLKDFNLNGSTGLFSLGSNQNDYTYVDTDFSQVGVLPASIVLAEDALSGQNVDFYGCNFEVNQTTYSAIFQTDSMTDCWFVDSSISFVEGITSIPDLAFTEAEFSSYEFPSTLVSIGYAAFAGNLNLSDVVIPEGVEVIGDFAFESSTTLSSVVIPASTLIVGELAFSNNYPSATIYVTSGTSLLNFHPAWADSSYNFEYDSAGIIKQDGLVYVGLSDLTSHVVSYCNEKDVVIASEIDILGTVFSVTQINSNVFSRSLTLETVFIPETIKNIMPEAFSGCSSLWQVMFMPNSQLEFIGEEAFAYLKYLESFTLPKNVGYVGENAFAYNYSLNSFSFEDNAILENIPVGMFYNNFSLLSIEIPKSVVTINQNAFFKCYSLTTVSFEEGSLLEYIRESAFEDCDNFGAITIPASVVSIEARVFYSNNNLSEVTFLEGSLLNYVGDSAFKYNTALQTIDLPDSVSYIGPYAFSNCTNLTSFRVPLSLTEISDNMFYFDSNLQEVIFPEGSIVNSIGQFAFSNNDKLMSIDLPETLLVIKYSAFTNCDALETIVLPDTVILIDDYAFLNCVSLTMFSISNTSQLTTIGNSAFKGNTSLIEIYIPESVTLIEDYAFQQDVQLVIYAAASEQPALWQTNWNLDGAVTVYWGS